MAGSTGDLKLNYPNALLCNAYTCITQKNHGHETIISFIISPFQNRYSQMKERNYAHSAKNLLHTSGQRTAVRQHLLLPSGA